MSRPLSNAETTFMPELYPDTQPMAVAHRRGNCAWCDIRLNAIPQAARPVFAPDGQIVYTHPTCTAAFRQVVNYRSEGVPFEHRGTSDPR